MGKNKGTIHGKNAILRSVYGFSNNEANKIRRIADELQYSFTHKYNKVDKKLAIELIAEIAKTLQAEGEHIDVHKLREKAGLK